MSSRKIPKRSVIGTELALALASEGRHIFSTDQARELASHVGIKDSHLCKAFDHLRRNGWIEPIRRGLYALSEKVPGSLPAHEFGIAVNMASPAAISYYTAMNFHGFTDQIPGRIFVLSTTDGSVPRARKTGKRYARNGGYVVGNTIYQFVQVRPERFFGIEEFWICGVRVPITDPERTLLDGLSHPRYCICFGEVMHAFNVRGDNLDMERIVNYALRLDAATAKRLGWVLEYYKFDPSRFRELLDLPISGYRKLDPTGPRKGRLNRRWMIQENLLGTISP